MSELKDYAMTDRQKEIVVAWEKYGRNASKAAASLGVGSSTVRTLVSQVKNAAAKVGFTDSWDATHLVGEGEIVLGRSVYASDALGNKTWLKTIRNRTDIEKQKALEGFVEGLTHGLPKYKPQAQPKKKKYNSDLLPTIIIGDAHFGMRADARETKSRDYDTKIAVQDMMKAIDYLVDAAPASEQALLINVGDFIHANGSSGTTFSGTSLDVDTRIEVVLESAAQTFMYAISKILTKSKSCTVIIARGNHDSDTAIALAMILKFYYSKEKRVTILDPQGFYHTLQFGKNLLAVHHGDKVKAEKLATILPKMLPDQWSSTVYRKWILGHFHHQVLKERDNGVLTEIFSTLAPPDSWHSSRGYGASCAMHQIVFHREGGEAIRHVYQIRESVQSPDITI